MRLNKIKLAGFKSFVDPTVVQLPSNLTGVVGPNGCGKSNVIDAVRWVMGELSARHLRGDSMADVIFNGSSSRKPVGTASVELLFDNSDGKIGGAYANYSEISLKRAVSRDGTSAYFINGARCRRKDITQLFLGTGLGARSYAIIEQGMISRVIEARADDMRAFIEEAAGISLYKERRKETESRVAEARENLARLQDVRDEVDKQIRHLQRQAGAARRYQELRNQQRLLTAEMLALKLRDIDSGAEVHDGAMRSCELAMQQALSEQRAVEAAIEKQRSFHVELGSALARVQGRYYELGAEITRTEENIRFSGELRARQRTDLAQTVSGLQTLGAQIEADRLRLQELAAELTGLDPEAERLRGAEAEAAIQLAAVETQLGEWQNSWESFNSALGSASQTMQVETARMEQLEGQLLRLRAQADRLSIEREGLDSQQAGAPLPMLTGDEAAARQRSEAAARNLQEGLTTLQQLRDQQRQAETELAELRIQRERRRAELVSLEALQKAALGEKDARASAWLEGLGGRHHRLAERIEVDNGWERAVETALGDYLEAVCVEGLEALESSLQQLHSGNLGFIECDAQASRGGGDALAAHVSGPVAVQRLLSGVRTCGSLAQALRQRATLSAGESLVTPEGEWIGRDWLRVRRGSDPHAGVLEREQRLKGLREQAAAAEQRLQDAEQALARVRERILESERSRDEFQLQVQHSQREHGELRSQLEVMRARLEEAGLRRARLDAESADVAQETERARDSLHTARAAHLTASSELQRLDAQRPALEEERESRREQQAVARSRAQSAQLALRDALVKQESRRSAHGSMDTSLQRMLEQRVALTARHDELESALSDGDQPIRELELRLQAHLQRRVEVEAELTTARSALEAADTELRQLELRRGEAETRAAESRSGLEVARLSAQESRLRREALLEQFAATRHELGDVTATLPPDALAVDWESRIAIVDADIEKLGQVNLAAIDELKEQGERKVYLDRQYNDVNDALQTLEDAMRKIDKETRSRFDDTFNRINAGLQEKFPRLFGGGHAYLQLEGDDPLMAGVAVMARPPGKRNSTIAQLSGGEKALTAVALVFSIFDLNPAPFCLLDEVDAPLDEHNVGRFCDIVREMSSRVQFIFITHNKSTMELASQLLGVTMNEPGVSRLVAVDVDEAVRMAAV